MPRPRSSRLWLIAFALAAPLWLAANDAPRAHVPPTDGSEEVVALWEAANAAEKDLRSAEAAAEMEKLLALEPDQVHVRWRTARNLMGAAEAVVEEDPDGAVALVREARRHAQKGRELDPSCAECCFYDFAALAREAGTLGFMSSIGKVTEMKPILDDCLENPATWADSDWHNETAMLYFGAAQLYRLTPDSSMVSWMIGYRGDAEKALLYARKAADALPTRIDMRAELVTALLCVAEREDEPLLAEEAERLVAGFDELPKRMPHDDADRARAEHLVENPGEACAAARNVKMD